MIRFTKDYCNYCQKLKFWA